MTRRWRRKYGQLFWYDPEMLAIDVMNELEAEFGEARMPEPHGSIWHQSLSSDFEMGSYLATCDRDSA